MDVTVKVTVPDETFLSDSYHFADTLHDIADDYEWSGNETGDARGAHYTIAFGGSAK